MVYHSIIKVRGYLTTSGEIPYRPLAIYCFKVCNFSEMYMSCCTHTLLKIPEVQTNIVGICTLFSGRVQRGSLDISPPVGGTSPNRRSRYIQPTLTPRPEDNKNQF